MAFTSLHPDNLTSMTLEATNDPAILAQDSSLYQSVVTYASYFLLLITIFGRIFEFLPQ